MNEQTLSAAAFHFFTKVPGCEENLCFGGFYPEEFSFFNAEVVLWTSFASFSLNDPCVINAAGRKEPGEQGAAELGGWESCFWG